MGLRRRWGQALSITWPDSTKAITTLSPINYLLASTIFQVPVGKLTFMRQRLANIDGRSQPESPLHISRSTTNSSIFHDTEPKSGNCRRLAHTACYEHAPHV